jgi:hypothetical protein
MLIGGIFAAPNMSQAAALAAAASLGALVAGVRAVRVFVPQLTTGLASRLGIPQSWVEVVITAGTTFGLGFLTLVEGVLSAPNLDAARAAAVAGFLALGTAVVRVLQAAFTPGESPVDGGGIVTPPQPVVPAALPAPTPDPQP